MPALQKKHKKSSVHNIKSVMNTRYGCGGRTRTYGLRVMSSKQSVCYRSATSRKVLILLTFSKSSFYIVE